MPNNFPSARVRLTPSERGHLDGAILKMIRANPGTRTMDILADPAIQEILETLPRGLESFRHVDNSLQRLRKAKRITASTNRWTAIKAKADQ